MGGRLTKLSDTRWRYESGNRVYYVRQVRAPDEDADEPGRYLVDGGEGHFGALAADSVEEVVDELRRGQPAPW